MLPGLLGRNPRVSRMQGAKRCRRAVPPNRAGGRPLPPRGMARPACAPTTRPSTSGHLGARRTVVGSRGGCRGGPAHNLGGGQPGTPYQGHDHCKSPHAAGGACKPAHGSQGLVRAVWPLPGSGWSWVSRRISLRERRHADSTARGAAATLAVVGPSSGHTRGVRGAIIVADLPSLNCSRRGC